MNFNNQKDYDLFLKKLYSNSNEKYKKFQERLVKDIQIIGISIPVLKSIAKEISKNNYVGFFKYNTHETLEEILIHGLVLGYIDDINIFDFIDDFLTYNNNWASTDSTCSNLKMFNNVKFDYIYKYINSNNPWTIRFGLVLLLNYYIKEENLDKIFKICDEINTNEYYVQMANAWLISICFIKYKKETYNYLLSSNLDKFTFNKAISKICDSYRVSDDDKIKLRGLRKN